MLKSEAISRIQRRLGFMSSLSSEITEELKDAQVKFEKGIILPSGGVFLPWFLQTEISTAWTTSGEERVSLPSDFLKEAEGDGLWYFNADAEEEEDVWTLLQKDDLDFLRKNLPGSGAPQGYALDGMYLRILPVPDAAYRLKMLYFGSDTVLDTEADGTNKWLTHAPYLMIGEAGYEISFSARDSAAPDYFDKMRAREINRLWAFGEAREHENRSYAMGGED